ncbi:MAG: hypothetical protein HKN49_05410, partial [Gammaproteobacteria bacterium]|nr:hypothetical protein [Gammaproteobacteria bacterium]
MNKLFRELERRNVFRIGGFYLGIAWVCIEASSVILPELNAPKWVLRGIIGLAVAGFPVALGLAWVYEITSEGIERDEDVDRSATAGRGRQFDFVVIGVLVVALTVSVYLNIVSRRAPVVIDALPLLIADFDNQTGEPLFDGSIEQALTIGLEGAPFVTAYPRKQALSAAAAIRTDGTTRLDSEVALLIGVREDLGGVLIGTIESVRSGYRLQARVVEPGSQENLARASVSADSKLDVLAAVGELAEDLRSDLGDVTVGERDELITVASLEAAKA